MFSTATLRAVVLGAGLGFVVAVVPSCGPSKPSTLPDGGVIGKCNRNTCSGCCDESGSCFTGASPEACGLDGVTCQVCKTGQSCSKTGVCSNGTGGGTGGSGGAGGHAGGGSTGGGTGGATGGGAGGGTGGATGGGTGGSGGGSAAGGGTGGGAASCSNVNCPNGCCDPVNGSCRVGTADNACGAGGLACKVCNVGLGQSCQNNACVGGTCDATSCPTGCCSGMTCVTPPNANQCGIMGATCQTCSGANPTCDVDAGVCLGGAGGGAGGSGGTGGFGGFGGAGGFGGFGGGSISLPCSPACQAGECCDFGILCAKANATCLFTSFITPGATCNGATGMCQ